MRHNTLKFIIFSFLITMGCTNSGSGDSTSLVGSITDTVKDIMNSDPSVNTAEKQVVEIQNNLNKDNTYALTHDDVAFLKTEGLLSNENELKGWAR